MVAAGMMKMTTGDDFPLRQGAGTGLDWFFMATEACGGGTSDLGSFLDVSVYIGFFQRWNHAKMGLEVTTSHLGEPGPSGAPWWVVPTSWLFWPSHEASSASFVSKKIVKMFVAFGELLFLHKKQHHGSSAENSASPG
jgi:hypothetical protein